MKEQLTGTFQYKFLKLSKLNISMSFMPRSEICPGRLQKRTILDRRDHTAHLMKALIDKDI